LGLGNFSVRLPAAIGLGFGLFGAIAGANASGCPGNPGAMGTSRVLKIDPREYPLIGTVQYQETLPLNDKEVVLTFDDGPMPPYTNRVLKTLAHDRLQRT
jgi:peptidoglycan/xylan/chitin deacetylase (PgdA/CDA1 family)